MLKTKQILGSSSSSTTSGFSFVPQRLKKPCSNFLLISRKPIEATVSKSSETPFWASQFRKVCFLRAFQMSRSLHSESTPFGPSPPSSSTSTSITSTGITKRINFCESCGGATKYEIPDGEERMRAVCTRCGKIAYENPKMVVGCLIEHEDKILLCKRNIQPSQGLWTIPAGFMEIGESAAEGAIRETLEEANAEVEVESPFAQLDLPLIGQTYIIFLAKLKRPQFSPGPESSECQLFALEDIPYESLAFSSMLVTLKLYMEDKKKNGRPKFHYGIINKRPGTSPSDIHAYTLEDHFTC